MEEWRRINWNSLYEVSNFGRVRNRKSGKILTTNPTKSHKRPQVWLWSDYFGTTCQHTLARLVYYTFNPTAGYGLDAIGRVYHRDGDVMNCKLENLYVKK